MRPDNTPATPRHISAAHAFGARQWRAVDLAIVALYGVLLLPFWWVAEDAYITFRFGRNLALGHGVLFNPGMPAVDGYTNFLWVLLSSAFEWVGVQSNHGMHLWTIAAGLGCMAVIERTGRLHLDLSPRATRGALLLWATFPPVLSWSTSGMEVMPQTLCFLVAAVWLALEQGKRAPTIAGLALAGLALLRFEGFMWWPVLIGLAVVLRRLERRPIWPMVRGALLVAVPPVLAWYAWRVGYYGTWVPNSVIAKTLHVHGTLGRGLWYLVLFAALELTPLLLLACVGPTLKRLGQYRGAWLLLMTLAVPAWAAVVGGDYMQHFRFLVPATPFLALTGAVGLQHLLDTRSPATMTKVAGAVALLGYLPAWGQHVLPVPVFTAMNILNDTKPRPASQLENGKIKGHSHRDLYGEAMVLAAATSPGETLVTSALGQNGYFSEASLLDLCGLIDPGIARRVPKSHLTRRPGHEKCTNPKHFIKRKPDVLHYDVLFQPSNPTKQVEKAVADLVKRFDNEHYMPEVVPWHEGDRYLIGVLMRRIRDSEHETALKQSNQAWRDRLSCCDKAMTPSACCDWTSPAP